MLRWKKIRLDTKATEVFSQGLSQTRLVAKAQYQQTKGYTVTLPKKLSVPEPQCQSQGVNLMNNFNLQKVGGETPTFTKDSNKV
jgi:hypothetical protein